MVNPVKELNDPIDVLISDGTSISASINLGGRKPVGVLVPASWTAADITFQSSVDGTNFYDVYDVDGAELTVTVASSRIVAIASGDSLCMGPYVKVRSGTTGTPVNQSGDITLQLIATNLSD